MTNEEIVLEIQNGNREKIVDLWEHTERFIAMKARKYIENSSFSMEWAEDLTQAGYFALVNAAADYDPGRGASFIHYLTFHLQNSFREALGIKTEKQEGDPIHHAAGLDTPITDREGDSFTLADIYGADDPGIENAEHEVYVEELRAILFREIAALPEDQATTIKCYFWQGMTYAEIAEKLGVSTEGIRQRKAKALRKIRQRRNKSGLAHFVEERTPYYVKVGSRRFNVTHTSAVELAVLRREAIAERKANGN